jgi:hypothetical protein
LSKNSNNNASLLSNFGADGWFRPSISLGSVAMVSGIVEAFVDLGKLCMVCVSSSGHIAGTNLGDGSDSDDIDVSLDVVN